MLRVATAQVLTAQAQAALALAGESPRPAAELPARAPEPVELASEPMVPATEKQPAAARASVPMSVPAALEPTARAPEWCSLAQLAPPASASTQRVPAGSPVLMLTEPAPMKPALMEPEPVAAVPGACGVVAGAGVVDGAVPRACGVVAGFGGGVVAGAGTGFGGGVPRACGAATTGDCAGGVPRACGAEAAALLAGGGGAMR